MAIDAWLKTQPIKNPKAPNSPFIMKEYSQEEQREAQQISVLSDKKFHESSAANHISDRYVLLTVTLAAVSFFGGISSKFESRKSRLLLMTAGTLLFVGSIAMVLSFPWL